MNPLSQTLDLVRKAQVGDRDALNRLFDRYYERVRRSVRVRLGSHLRRHLESGDILQRVFAKAFQKFDGFEMRHEGSFLNWLAEIAVGQIHDVNDHVKSKKRDPGKPLVDLDATFGDASGSLAESVPTGDTGPAGRSVRNEREAAVEECLSELADHYREVIVLRDYDGLEWRDIAQKMGKNSDSAPRELHKKALLELSKLMLRRGFRPEAAP